MKRATLKLSEIKPYGKNNRKHSPEQIERLAAQIQAHGFDQPIVVDENYVIIKGHARLKALKKLKEKTTEVIVNDQLTEEQKKAARIADNQLGLLSEWDTSNLVSEMDELRLVDFDVMLTGFDKWDLDPDAAENSDDFEPHIPEDRDEKKETKYGLVVHFDDPESMDELFIELKDRGLKVKSI